MDASSRDEVIGREAELSVVASFLDDVPAGPVALLLEGEAGVGKTTVWKEGVGSAAGRSYRILACRPSESEAKLSFAALGDLMDEALADMGLSLPPPQARALDVALLRAEPEGAPLDSRAVSLAVLEVLRAIARDRPAIVAIDDIQWLDAPTARVLEFCLRRLEAEPIGILATLRDPDGAEAPLGLARTLPEGRLRRLALGPLSVDGLEQLLRARLGGEFLRPTLVRLHDMSGGNPFFAIEIARASMRGDRPATGQLLPVPQNLREMVRRRLKALSPRAREAALAAAALSAPTVDLVDAAMTAGAEAAEAADDAGGSGALAEAAEAGVIEVEGGQVRFAHALFGSVIFSEASSEQRRALHRRLAGLVADPEERARHLALGAEGPDEDVAVALDAAAGRARSRGAPDAAAELWEMAMRLTPNDRHDERRRRTMDAARHLHEAGDTARARVLLEEAVEGSPPGPERAQALRALAGVRATEGGWPPSVELLRRALAEAGEDPALRGPIEQVLGYAGLFTGDLPVAERHGKEALALAEVGGEPAQIAEGLQFVAYVDFVRGRGMRSEVLDRAIAIERETEEYWVRNVRPSFVKAQLLKYMDDFDTSREGFQALLERALDRGQEHPIPVLFHHLAELECWAGNWDIAERHARRSLEAAVQTGMGFYRAMAMYSNALVDGHRGRVDPAREAAVEGLRLAESAGVVTTQIQNLSVLGFLELFMGNPSGAHGHLGRAAELMTAMGVEEPGVFRFVPDEVESLVALGRLEEASALLEPFEERARRLNRGWALATGARCRGLVLAASGDVPGALEALDAALEHHRTVPEPFALARTFFSRGRIQRRAKLKQEARESFERALEIYRRLGAHGWAERAGRETRRVGVRASSRFALTATEERVASLVAQGSRNKQVADALFMSVNTVEWNLSKIYRKLGVRSRSELASMVAKGTLGEPRL